MSILDDNSEILRADGTVYGVMTVVETFDADTDAPAFEVRRTVDPSVDPMGYKLVHYGRKTSWPTRDQAEAVVRVFEPHLGRDGASVAVELPEAQVEEALDTVIDVEPVFDGLHDTEPSDIRILMHPSQAAKLAELLRRHVDLDVVEHDNDDPKGAQFVRDLLAAYDSATV